MSSSVDVESNADHSDDALLRCRKIRTSPCLAAYFAQQFASDMENPRIIAELTCSFLDHLGTAMGFLAWAGKSTMFAMSLIAGSRILSLIRHGWLSAKFNLEKEYPGLGTCICFMMSDGLIVGSTLFFLTEDLTFFGIWLLLLGVVCGLIGSLFLHYTTLVVLGDYNQGIRQFPQVLGKTVGWGIVFVGVAQLTWPPWWAQGLILVSIGAFVSLGSLSLDVALWWRSFGHPYVEQLQLDQAKSKSFEIAC